MKASLVLFVHLIALSSLAQKKFDAFDSLISFHERKYGFGGAILIAEQDSVIYQNAIGWENYNRKESLKLTTSIPLASITKSFTAAAIMILKQQNKLDYDDLVKKYISDFPYDEVTIRHLLNHTAGFKRLEDNFEEKDLVFDHHDILRYLVKAKPRLSFEPGSKFQYSNTGYSILACILENISGFPYSEFMEKTIFEPLRMTSSFVMNKTLSSNKRAITYNKKWRIEERSLDSYTGAIGICSTVTDLLRFDSVLYTDRLITQNVLHEGFKIGTLNDGTTIRYTFGWRHWKGSESQLFNRGDWWGISTIMFRDIEKKQAIIILANKDIDVDSSVLVQQVIEVLNRL